jgi:hypothetical protein
LNAPLLGGAVGKPPSPLGPGRCEEFGLVDGDGPPQPAIAMIATMPAACRRPSRGRRDIGP